VKFGPDTGKGKALLGCQVGSRWRKRKKMGNVTKKKKKKVPHSADGNTGEKKLREGNVIFTDLRT